MSFVEEAIQQIIRAMVVLMPLIAWANLYRVEANKGKPKRKNDEQVDIYIERLTRSEHFKRYSRMAFVYAIWLTFQVIHHILGYPVGMSPVIAVLTSATLIFMFRALWFMFGNWQVLLWKQE